jgi:medium-chain acyl-[acyl-carrier-protein] hydrolase
MFHSWHVGLPEEVEVYGIQLPGRANRFSESPCTSVSQVVTELAPAMVFLIDKPFAFFGHSMGAILSFEVARWLRAHRAVLPRHMFVSGRRAPQVPDFSPWYHQMSDVQFINHIFKMNGTPQEVLSDPELLRLVLPAIRADVQICETYQYVNDKPLGCPITAFAGGKDDEETASRMEGWVTQTTSLFSMHILRGDHFFIHSNERELLQLLRDELCRIVRMTQFLANR